MGCKYYCYILCVKIIILLGEVSMLNHYTVYIDFIIY